VTGTDTLLGISPYHPDAATSFVRSGCLQLAAEEERFNRIKHSAGFPSGAIAALSGSRPGQYAIVPVVARARRARILRKALQGARLPRLTLARAKAWRRFDGLSASIARSLGADTRVAEPVFVEHHRAHLASSFFVSPFEQAALLSVDGLGDFASAMWGVGRGNHIEVHAEVTFPHSLGFYYTAVTQYLGFQSYGDEYKVMGLASYGQPEFLDLFRKIVRPDAKRGFLLGLEYFRHHKDGIDMTWAEGPPRISPLWSERLAGELGPARQPDEDITERHENIAASLQARLEEVLFDMLRRLHERTKLDDLCLAGGVAYNCAANGKIFRQTPFRRVYVPPAPGDSGLAVGAPLWVWHQEQRQPRQFVMDRADWGPAYSEAEMRAALDAQKIEYVKIESEDELCRKTAQLIADGHVVGWFQGRMEFGPRALGNRSILADPRRADMKDILNRRIKYREPFRPFAPSILAERQGEYFEETNPSPFMSFAFSVKPEKGGVIPAVTHVDGTARLQTVTREAAPLYHALISAFDGLTDVPVVLNTSFNENEPIVNTPAQAVDCFLRTHMDALVMGPFIAVKPESPVLEAE
jgi:carbamoyltransferase